MHRSASKDSNSKDSNTQSDKSRKNQNGEDDIFEIEYSDVKSEGMVKVYNELSRVNDNINNRVEIARRAAREEFLQE